MSLPPHHRFPYGTRDESDPPPRPWLDDDEPHHAGDDEPASHRLSDDDDEPQCADCKANAGYEEERESVPIVDDSAEPEPERLACRQCGKPCDEPRLSPDGVCPLCREDLEER